MLTINSTPLPTSITFVPFLSDSPSFPFSTFFPVISPSFSFFLFFFPYFPFLQLPSHSVSFFPSPVSHSSPFFPLFPLNDATYLTGQLHKIVSLCFHSICYFFVLEPRSCVMEKEELCDGLRVLMFKDGLFYEGKVTAIQPPDV